MSQSNGNVAKRVLKSCLWFGHYLSWVYGYLKLMAGCNALKDIKILSIEFCSICNLRCKYCFIEQKGRARFLDINIYEKLIKEVAGNPKYKIKIMEWPISGEFFVYRDYKRVIEITKKYMDENPNFRPHVILNENFMLFDEEKIDLILKSGVVKQLICSFDGHDAKSFEDMRPPAQFEQCLQNFRTFVKRNKELGNLVHIQINNGRDENSIGQKFSEEMEEILRAGDSVTQWKPKFWNESFNGSKKVYKPAKGFCSFVFNNVTLSSSGEISKCCMDLKGSTVYADLSKYTLAEIWHSNARRQFLTLMFKNRRDLLKGCNTCAITFTNNDNRYTNKIRTIKRRLMSLIYGKKYYLKPLE